MGFFTGTRYEDGRYEPATLHRWLRPKVAGNSINGLGETEVRRPTPIYHWLGRGRKVPHNIVSLLLIIRSILDPGTNKHFGRAAKAEKEPPAPIAPVVVHKSPEEWTEDIKQYALNAGADLVGLIKVRPEFVFEGFEVPDKWLIMLGLTMEYDELAKAPEPEGAHEVLKVYADGNEISSDIANWIRNQGWDAKGYCGPMASPIVMVPAALEAGFGELGKHGSIINRTFGSNLRLAYVITDLELVEDKHDDDFGADDFCARCQVCTKECPPGAITDEKQMVRGIERWYVDFDKCLPFFNDTQGCGVCIAVCPWSRPGVADNLVAKLARRKQRKLREEGKSQPVKIVEKQRVTS